MMCPDSHILFEFSIFTTAFIKAIFHYTILVIIFYSRGLQPYILGCNINTLLKGTWAIPKSVKWRRQEMHMDLNYKTRSR